MAALPRFPRWPRGVSASRAEPAPTKFPVSPASLLRGFRRPVNRTLAATGGIRTVKRVRVPPYLQCALRELKIDASHSRPRVSNDNAFSEAHFKTLKTQPDYPARFTDIGHAPHWCGEFFDWYNDEHQHSGLNGHKPGNVSHGRAQAVTDIKQGTLHKA